MKSLKLITGTVFATFLAFGTVGSQAALLSFTGLDIAGINGLTPAVDPLGGLTPDSSSNFQIKNNTGLQSGCCRSPWEGSDHDGSSYATVGAGGFVEFVFTVARDSLSFLWGSPDTYNDLTITLDNNTVIDFDGSDVFGSQGTLASVVTVSELAFTKVRFASSTNAFEFANLSVGPELRVNEVPLPAAAWLFLSVLGGAGILRRRKAFSKTA